MDRPSAIQEPRKLLPPVIFCDVCGVHTPHEPYRDNRYPDSLDAWVCRYCNACRSAELVGHSFADYRLDSKALQVRRWRQRARAWLSPLVGALAVLAVLGTPPIAFGLRARDALGYVVGVTSTLTTILVFRFAWKALAPTKEQAEVGPLLAERIWLTLVYGSAAVLLVGVLARGCRAILAAG